MTKGEEIDVGDVCENFSYLLVKKVQVSRSIPTNSNELGETCVNAL